MSHQQNDSFVLDVGAAQDGPLPRERVPDGSRRAVHEQLADHAVAEIDSARDEDVEVVERVAVPERESVERTQVGAEDGVGPDREPPAGRERSCGP